MSTPRKRTITPAPARDMQGDLKALAQMQYLSSIIASRASLAASMGKSFGGKRDLYEALGYPRVLQYDDYYAQYQRGGIATRIIEAPVNGVWEQKPEIIEDVGTETQFEKDIQEVIKKKRLFHYLRRVDILSCIGQYAVLLLGVDDGQTLDQPLETGGAKELLYMQPYSEISAPIGAWEKDATNPRYGQPVMYRLKMQEPGQPESFQIQDVHYTRVIHVAQGLLESNVYGIPRLERVFNRLLSLELIVGGSGEMFWQGAFPGLQFNADPEMNMTMTADDTKEKIDEYVHGLKRYLTTQGLDVTKLNSDVADPTNHMDVQLTVISIATGIPRRILEGSERGELASSQDEKNWNDRLDSRRRDETEPSLLRPVVDRLMDLGIVAPPSGGEYTVNWPDLSAPSNKEKADTGYVRTQAIEKYVNSGADMLVQPRQFFEEVLDMAVDQVDRMLAGTEDTYAALKEEERQAQADAAAQAAEQAKQTPPQGQPNV